MKESINENFKRLASQRMKRIFQTANLLADYQTENNTHVEHKRSMLYLLLMKKRIGNSSLF
ncbi:hypothetical protein ES895_27330 [Bacillus sp. 007/AIA-02/001]|uniref:hypothetical protein n=1 Tax=Bacillus sp. 007/AIA-02/001 TaxID=2509009 RepID=UPI0010753E3A|nr:hypothetical protein [Bacillus sp. 007/AIA-02/001]MCU5440125.1 hypothetical protein [Bacillus cereus]TFW48622.1 hypothetical protein ES895_27330 [Bacillus sp. 007/AIA-02/001]